MEFTTDFHQPFTAGFKQYPNLNWRLSTVLTEAGQQPD